MINHQKQIFSENRKLISVWRTTTEPEGVVVLLSGLGYTKSEYAYFYSRVSRSLSNKYCTVQFDYTGCGDSDGDFSEASFPILLHDVNAVINDVKNNYPGLPLTIISRGIGTWLAAYSKYHFSKWIIWNPALTIPKRIIKELIDYAGQEELIEIADFPIDKLTLEWKLFSESLGVGLWLLRGECFSVSQLKSLIDLKPEILLNKIENHSSVYFLLGSKWRLLPQNRFLNEFRYTDIENFDWTPYGQDWARDTINQIMSI